MTPPTRFATFVLPLRPGAIGVGRSVGGRMECQRNGQRLGICQLDTPYVSMTYYYSTPTNSLLYIILCNTFEQIFALGFSTNRTDQKIPWVSSFDPCPSDFPVVPEHFPAQGEWWGWRRSKWSAEVSSGGLARERGGGEKPQEKQITSQILLCIGSWGEGFVYMCVLDSCRELPAKIYSPEISSRINIQHQPMVLDLGCPSANRLFG